MTKKARFLSLLKILGPAIVALTVPGGSLLVPIIISAITAAEKISGATGAEKKAAAIELVQVGAAAVTAASGGKVTIDPEVAAVTASAAIETTIGVINLVRDSMPDPADAV